MLKEKSNDTPMSRFSLWRMKRNVNDMESRYVKYVKSYGSSQRDPLFGKKKQELEYNRSLLMPYYREDVIEALAHKKVTPAINNNLKTKRYKYGEAKEKVFRFHVAKLEVMEDLCRINNWTTRKDWKEHKVPVNKLFVELFKAAEEYSDILMYYSKLRFDERQSLMKGF